MLNIKQKIIVKNITVEPRNLTDRKVKTVSFWFSVHAGARHPCQLHSSLWLDFKRQMSQLFINKYNIFMTSINVNAIVTTHVLSHKHDTSIFMSNINMTMLLSLPTCLPINSHFSSRSPCLLINRIFS